MADEADLDAIRAWVAAGGQMGVDRSGNPVVPADVVNPSPAAPAAPTPAPDEPPPTQPTPQPTPQPAKKAAKKPAKKPAKKGKSLIGRISQGLGDWAANVPTPGGNLALVLILLFFAFAIIPVNAGQTRLQLIWDVLTGNADLPGNGQASGPTSAAGNVASTIGTGAQAVASGVGGVFSTIGTGAQGVLSGASGGASGGGPGGPNAAGYIPPQQQSGAGLLEPPRG